MLLLFLRIATAESCDFIASTCLWGCIFETQNSVQNGGGGILLGDNACTCVA